MNNKLKIVEIFSSIEGEGIRAGELATFIRVFGCNLNCKYCDSRYACEESSPAAFTEMTVDEILWAVKQRGYKKITVTGGEPLIHHNIFELLKALSDNGFYINIETNGSVDLEKIPGLSNLFYTCDFKCLYSGMSNKMCLKNINFLKGEDVLKFVVADTADLQQACSVLIKYKPVCWIYFSPVFGKIEPKEIVEFMKEHDLQGKVRVQLQLHKYIYPHDMRGV